MSSSTLLTLAAAPIFFFALWYLTATLTPAIPPILRNKRIILLIAHPDDESMFFSPTLQSLTAPHLQNHLKILCLSTGNSDGLGATRRKELEAAALTLGVRRREDIFVLDDEKRFKDGMNEKWDPKDISHMLASAFAPQLNTPSPPASIAPSSTSSQQTKEDKRSSKSKSSRKSQPSTPTTTTTPPLPTTTATQNPPRATIDVLLTFDRHGISSHPNHIALHTGAHFFLTNLMRDHPGYSCPVSLYTLTTVNIVRKYSFILDSITTLISGILEAFLGGSKDTSTVGKASSAKKSKAEDRVMVVSDMFQYWKAREAMVKGHRSQMVWFRWGWIGVGRYMVVNDLKRERVRGVGGG